MPPDTTEQERRAREFKEARAALVLAALLFVDTSAIQHADNQTCELSASLARYYKIADMARVYRLAEAALVKR